MFASILPVLLWRSLRDLRSAVLAHGARVLAAGVHPTAELGAAATTASPRYDRIDDVTEGLWDKVLDVNLKGPFRLTAMVGTRMAAGAGGSIIMVSSTAAVKPSAAVIPYAAAKAGVNAMTVAFSHAFGPTVRVNCIMPGPFLTDISKAWDMDAFRQFAKTSMALGRGGEPGEIVGAALYFASAASSFTTGAVLGIHGGV